MAKTIQIGNENYEVVSCDSFIYNVEQDWKVVLIVLDASLYSAEQVNAIKDALDTFDYYDNTVLKASYEGYNLQKGYTLANDRYTITARKTSDLQLQVTKLTNIVAPSIDAETCTLEEAQAYQNNVLNTSSTETIANGIDVVTTVGTEHFSLSVFDQLDLKALYDLVEAGATAVKYHADHTFCRLFTADEIKLIYATGMQFIEYHTTLLNHLHMWVNRSTTVAEVLSIQYTSQLPDDLQQHMNDLYETTN